MRPKGMREQSSRGDGVFRGAEAERRICKMLGEDEAGDREQGGVQVTRIRQELAGQALLHQVEYPVWGGQESREITRGPRQGSR